MNDPSNHPDPARLASLSEFDNYYRLFMDLDLWEPFVRQVCERHALACRQVTPGLAGTCPTFVVDERWVVKFYGQLFDGQAAFTVEREAARLLEGAAGIPSARLLAAGDLLAGGVPWHWPYLVFQFLPGKSIGEAWGDLPLEERVKVAVEMGQVIRQLHGLSLGGSAVFQAGWEAYLGFLGEQKRMCAARHRIWGRMPSHLLDQINDYLLPLEDWIDPGAQPHLIHADLTRDHLLGTVEQGMWRTSGLIDFGDAMTGDLHYELAALHLDLFDCDRRLLHAFLTAYGVHDTGERFIRKAMSAALLHRFDCTGPLFDRFPELKQVKSLEALAEWLWDVRRV